MNNLQIISTEMKLNGINEDVDTYAGWNRRGYQVKKGSKALFKTKIWKPVKTAVEVEKKAKSDNLEETEIDNMIMVNAAFFGASQVDKK